MNVYEAVKQRIVGLCHEKGMTINKLATESGIPRSSLKNILYGKSVNPGIVTLKMICDGLNVTLSEFFRDDIFLSLPQELK